MNKLLGYPINEELYQKIRKKYTFKKQKAEDIKRRKEVVLYLFSRDMTYQEIGKRVGITRERVRQILNREGLSGKQRQKLMKEKKQEEKRLQKEERLKTLGRTCPCGRVFVPLKTRTFDSNLCPKCYLKAWARLNNYGAQRKWGRAHYKETYAKEKARGFPAQKKYQLKHRERIIARHRRYYYKQSRKKFAIRTLRFIQTWLRVIGACNNGGI